MKKNMGTVDRAVRVVLAIVFGILAFTDVVAAPVNYILMALGAVFLLTSLISFCPLYAPFGISTCKTKK
ncbi:MAG: YgaP family membrane protein [Flavobacteriales bacterium]